VLMDLLLWSFLTERIVWLHDRESLSKEAWNYSSNHFYATLLLARIVGQEDAFCISRT